MGFTTIRHFQTGSMIEYPFEMRLAKIDDGRLSLTTVPLNDSFFAEASLLAELGNEWVSGRPQDGEVEVALS